MGTKYKIKRLFLKFRFSNYIFQQIWNMYSITVIIYD